MDVPEVDDRAPRLAGYVLYGRGYTVKVPACAQCARTLGVPWQEGLFEGQCQGCEVRLTGNP